MKYVLPATRERGDQLQTFRLRNGQVLELPLDARFILNEIYLDKVYDSPGFTPYAQLRSVLDLGANVGVFAAYVASQSTAPCVYCFEPSQQNFERLQRNVERNQLNVRLFNQAVSVTEGVASLSHAGSSVEYALTQKPVDDAEDVQCVAFEQVFDLCGVEGFDLLKIDIEGHEKVLLEGASADCLRRFRHIIVEWHYSWDELEVLAARLREIGFDAKPTLIEGHMRFLYATRNEAA